MQTIRLATDLSKWRADAVARVNAKFNRDASNSLHEMLADLANGGEIVKRSERQRQAILASIATATTAAAITQIVSELERS